MKSPKKYILLATLFIILFSISCSHDKVNIEALIRADSALSSDNDSLAFEILNEIEDSIVDNMNEAEYALYSVLINQTLDRLDYVIDDSLAQVASSYYLTHDTNDPYHEGLAYYYKGHALKQQNDISSIKWYNEAKECFKKCKNLRYEFLCWNYMGVVSDIRRDAVSAVEFYKKGVHVAKDCGSYEYLCSEYGALADSYSLDNKIDSMAMYLDSMDMYKEYYKLYDYDYYRIMALKSLRDKDYNTVLSYCDSADHSAIGRDVDYIRVEALVSMGDYETALEIVKKTMLCSDIYQLVASTEQCVKIYTIIGQLDSMLVYNDKYKYSLDSLEAVENNANVAICELSNRQKHIRIIQEQRWTFVFVIGIVSVVLLSFLLIYLVKRNNELKRSEKEINELKGRVFYQIQTSQVQLELINESLVIMRKLIGKEIALKLHLDPVLIKRQKVKLMYSCIDKYFQEITCKLNDYYRPAFSDEDDLICIIGHLFGVSNKQLATIITKTDSCVNMKLRRSVEKIKNSGLTDIQSKANELIIGSFVSM